MNILLLRTYFLASIFLIFSNHLSAQILEVNPTIPDIISAEDILTQVFVNQGIEVINVTYEGDEIAVGEFKNGLTHIGIEEGIVLSTGRSASLASSGPFGAEAVGSSFASADLNSSFISQNLSDIAVTNAVHDVGRFIIEFAASSDSIRFQYVFASEEYPEYGCTSFNDAMGLFISGPGINGPYENEGINIALVPDTDVPVAINNVHPLNPSNGCAPAFEEFYNDNNGMELQPVYDGFLDVFYSVAQVIPGEIYTLEIAIGDGGDNVFDSALFLAGESFGSDSLVVNTSIDVVSAIAETTGMVEVPFDFTGTKSVLFPISYQISGTTEYGVDYQSSLPQTGIINSADELLNWSIQPAMDGTTEIFEYIKIRFDAPAVAFDEYILYFLDEVSCEIPSDMTICEASPIELSVGNTGLDSLFYFENTTPMELPNNPGAVFSEIEVTGVPFEKLYTLDIIESVCINIEHNWLTDLDLYLRAPDGSYLELSTDNGSDCDDYVNTCFSPSATTMLDPLLGYDCSLDEMAEYTGTWGPEGNWRRMLDTPINGTWELICIDDTQGFTGTLQDWSITFSTKALRDFQVVWSTGETSATITVFPTETTTYQVTAGPDCTGEFTVEVLVDVANMDFEICQNESILFEGILFDENNPSGEIIYQNQAGCDSVIYVNLSFLETPETYIEATINAGEVYQFGGSLYGSTGIYEQLLVSQNGCDSLVILDLTVFTPPFTLFDTDTISTINCTTEYCMPFNEIEAQDFSSLVVNGVEVTSTIFTCENPELGILTFLPGGTNEVVLTDQNGYSDTSMVTVIPEIQTLPTLELGDLMVPFQFPLNNIPICGDYILVITNLCPDMSIDLDYDLIDSDTLVFFGDAANNPDGIFCLRFCDNLGFCYLQTFEVTMLDVNTNDFLNENLFQIFPNPTDDFFNLKTTLTTPIQSVDLYAVNGQLLKTWENPNASQSFDIQEFAAGVFYLKITTKEGIGMKKIIKQ